ncbi:MAG: DUF418 domain-containing protein [Bacteroidota bacterium]
MKTSRITLIDALRGFALAGVALVHFTEQYVAGPPPPGFMEGINGPIDEVVQGIIFVLFQGKFFGLFSLLFGISFAIQMDSAAQRGADFSGRFLWRAVFLFGIGYAHQCFYRGDILTIYALLVPFLIPFHRLDKKWVLLAAGICFLSVPRFVAYAIWQGESVFGLPKNMMESALEQAYFITIQSGTLTEVFQQNAGYGMRTKLDYQLGGIGRLYYTFGYFLLGLWLYKTQLFVRLDEYLPRVKKTLIGCAVAMFVAFTLTGIVVSFTPQPINFTAWLHVLVVNTFDWVWLAMVGAIVSAFILLYQKESWRKRLDFFVPYGRMALTNYLVQALMGTSLFFGWGFGLLGTIRTSFLAVLAILLITLQTWASKWWLARFRYGPLEWLWRSWTFGRWQPLRR